MASFCDFLTLKRLSPGLDAPCSRQGVADAGRPSLAARTESLLAAGQRVLAVDPFYFGESKITQRDYLYALLVAATGDRPLGIQSSQLAALARWARARSSRG